MNKKELEAFAREAAKGMKTEKDLNEFSQMLTINGALDGLKRSLIRKVNKNLLTLRAWL